MRNGGRLDGMWTKPPHLPSRYGGGNLSSVKRHIIAAVRKATAGGATGLAPVCAVQAPCLEGGLSTTGSLHDRKSRLLCRPYSLRAGQTLIVVAFNRGEKAGGSVGMGTADKASSFMQHAIFRGLLARPAELRDTLHYLPAYYWFGQCMAGDTSGTGGRIACDDTTQGCRFDGKSGLVCATDNME